MSQRAKKNLPEASVFVISLRMTSTPGRWSKFAGMCVTNKHTSIPGTGLPVTAFTTVPDIRGVPIWKGEVLSKKLTNFAGASFQKRTRTATTKRKRTPRIKGKYGNHNLIFDRRSEGSNAAIAH